MRRRLITAPTSSSPTTLQLFLPRSIPRTAIFIGMVLPSVAAASLRYRKRGAGHLISFPEVVDQLERDKEIDPAAIEIWFADEARVGQRTRSLGAGPGAVRDPRPRTINALPRPISLAPSVPRTVRAQPSSCPAATSRR